MFDFIRKVGMLASTMFISNNACKNIVGKSEHQMTELVSPWRLENRWRYLGKARFTFILKQKHTAVQYHSIEG